MAKYEIKDSVRNNIFLLLDRVDIKGSEAVAIIEIKNALSEPIPDAPTPAVVEAKEKK